MKILLLGGNGYVGSEVYSQLTNHDVTSWDLCVWGTNLGYSHMKDVKHITTHDLDAHDVIIMLSAHSSVGMCKQDPTGAIINNVHNTCHVAQLLGPNQKLIYASSTSVYGRQPEPCSETQESLQHVNWYDITKQMVDTLMKEQIQSGKQIMGLRFGTICGVSENTRSDLFLNNMVQNVRQQGHFWVNNLHVRRSVLAVKDAARAIRDVCEKPFVPGIYNLKSFDTHMQQAADLIKHKLNVSYEIRPPDHNTYDFTVDDDLFCKTFDWTPSQTIQDVIADLAQDGHVNSWCARANWPQGNSYAL